jgi:K+ transporter
MRMTGAVAAAAAVFASAALLAGTLHLARQAEIVLILLPLALLRGLAGTARGTHPADGRRGARRT